jgi:hypothetical protein
MQINYLKLHKKSSKLKLLWKSCHQNFTKQFPTHSCVGDVIEKNRITWAEHVARMGKERHVQSFGVETLGKETNGETQA